MDDGMDEVRRAEALSGIVRSQRQVAAALSALDTSDEKDRRAAMTALEHAHAGLDDALAEFYGVARMAGVEALDPPSGRRSQVTGMPLRCTTQPSSTMVCNWTTVVAGSLVKVKCVRK